MVLKGLAWTPPHAVYIFEEAAAPRSVWQSPWWWPSTGWLQSIKWLRRYTFLGASLDTRREEGSSQEKVASYGTKKTYWKTPYPLKTRFRRIRTIANSHKRRIILIYIKKHHGTLTSVKKDAKLIYLRAPSEPGGGQPTTNIYIYIYIF